MKSLVNAAVGMGVSTLWVREMTESAWILSPLVTGTIIAGGTLIALLVYLTGVPSRMGRAYGEAMGMGAAPGRVLTEAAFSTVAAMIWSFALQTLFGTDLR